MYVFMYGCVRACTRVWIYTGLSVCTRVCVYGRMRWQAGFASPVWPRSHVVYGMRMVHDMSGLVCVRTGCHVLAVECMQVWTCVGCTHMCV